MPEESPRERLGAAVDSFRSHGYSGVVLGVIGFAFLAALPHLLDVYVLGFHLGQILSVQVLIITMLWAFTAQSWNIMSGFTGQFSFGHAAYFGIGAYTTQFLIADFQLNPWITLVVAGIIASLYGAIVGGLSFRYDLSGHYFALATLAFAELLRVGVRNMSELNGANGYYRPLPAAYADGFGLAAFQFRGDLMYFYVILAFLAIVTLVAYLIKQSWIGLYFFSIREDEQAAESIGVPAFRYKILGIMLSAFFTAWAGTFWSMYFTTIRPGTVFGLFINVEVLLPAIVGGLGTIAGPIIGSFLVTPISEIARNFFGQITGLDRIIYGIFLVLIVLFSPKGAIHWPGQFRRLYGKIVGRFTGRADTSPDAPTGESVADPEEK
ncbi:branched-chain amino acid ABC transporter permease [Halobacteriales archaeon Cl-PHB]